MNDIEDFCLNFTINNSEKSSPLGSRAREVAESKMSVEDFTSYLFHVFYRTGVVGLKLDTYEKITWAYDGPPTIAAKTINLSARAAIHPTFWRVLGIGISS